MYQFALQDSNTAVSVKGSIKQKKGNMIPLNDKTMRVREYAIWNGTWMIPFLEVVIVILPGVFNNRLGY